MLLRLVMVRTGLIARMLGITRCESQMVVIYLDLFGATIAVSRVVFGAVAQPGERNAGSVEVRGSSPLSSTEPEWRNRQTRYVQGVVGNCPWEFKSPLRHPNQASTGAGLLFSFPE